MAKPHIMSHADWMRDTTVAKWHGRSDHERSQALKNVDLFLQDYHTSNDQWPQKLRLLETNLDLWIGSKTKSNGTLNTIRNNQKVRLLQQQVQAARTLPNPTAWSAGYPGILIAQDPFAGDKPVPDDFSARVRDDLSKLISKDRGKDLMAMLSRSCHDQGREVVIQCNPVMGGANQCAPVNVRITNDFRRALSELGGVSIPELMSNPALVASGTRINSGGAREFVPNTGANAVVKYNPDDRGEDADGGGFIGLAHELIHAYHFVNGICGRSPTGGTTGDQGGAEEEMRTVGAGAYKDEVPSENWIRAEWKKQMRKSYSGNDFSGTKATLFA